MDQAVQGRVAEFFTRFPVRKYKKGDVLVEQNDRGNNSVFYLKKGFVRMCSYSYEGEDVTILYMQGGSIFPMSLLLGYSYNSFCFEAATKVEVNVVPKKEVLDLLERDPSLVYVLTQGLAKGLILLSKRLQHTFLCNSEQRILFGLYIMMLKFGKSDETLGGWRLKIPLTHKEIAGYVGLSRETVSRKLDELIQDNVLQREGKHIWVKSLDGFKTMLKKRYKIEEDMFEYLKLY